MIRAVLFDAVGTIMKPTPSAAEAYAAAARHHGSTLDESTIAERFHRAFARQESLDREVHGGRTSECREHDRWQAIVREVLPDVVDGSTLFDELWRHFERPNSWAPFADVASAWKELAANNLALSVASNFDSRLLKICAALEPLATSCHVFVSSLVGWRKPNRQFFAAIERELNLSPDQLLLVGDDIGNDYEGARGAGWHAVLLDRADTVSAQTASLPDEHRISTLAELAGWLRAQQLSLKCP